MTRTWSEWLPHTAGEPCPISDARAGEWQWGNLEMAGDADGILGCNDAREYIGLWKSGTTNYRYLLPETPAEPVKDWESAAREWERVAGALAKVLHPFVDETNWADLRHDKSTKIPARMSPRKILAARAALSTYEAMKK